MATRGFAPCYLFRPVGAKDLLPITSPRSAEALCFSRIIASGSARITKSLLGLKTCYLFRPVGAKERIRLPVRLPAEPVRHLAELVRPLADRVRLLTEPVRPPFNSCCSEQPGRMYLAPKGRKARNVPIRSLLKSRNKQG